MAKYRVGVTEAGDAGIDLSWVQMMGTVDGAVVITKQITHGFLDAVLDHQKKLIVHATLTGYGGSILEPCVPTPDEQFEAVQALVDSGFPQEKIVIRVDPLIPTEKGLGKALKVIETCMDDGFRRYRVSVLDMYRHVRNRFRSIGPAERSWPRRMQCSAKPPHTGRGWANRQATCVSSPVRSPICGILSAAAVSRPMTWTSWGWIRVTLTPWATNGSTACATLGR